ncbi:MULTISPECIES: flagellar basal-body MS-ring/collar protein FliF [Pseudomonas]|uniref:Flagellar M-ring protein n=1 Tax=Pseudomonas extremaustralis TaxID=359110 RepID=A0A5C5QI70_9PSED|nr:flagellar basal-body MS-ring/collar protein FliF [Pseudomonas extremaustralis]EZI29180.1 flagellar M-ring protein FliF [Pseudomonas extremaustralis 14-3 substr. 14-3b]MDF3135174.1 flagellar basal-body MS-ring/collar protein FliF [Pseudomonas extremaustralis]MDY7067905.1 Flagellar M-ring protein [Pseudomonas extremaustralis]TWS05007.1 flagellar basal body M-ring protein FliF [Pseudomonas extremaustralis]SDE57812.1 flagellar M-ring protein FliF [Pseudomonas extremaustralis]
MAEAVSDNLPAKADGKPPLFGLSFLENLSEMTMLRQVGLMVGLAASVAIGFAVVLWSQQPDYRPLYGSLAGMDSKQIMETLAAADIAYTVEPNSGALLVKSDDVARARMKLAAAGVTPSDSNIGFEILDKDQGLGTSQFMEATRYRRGLEGELARTISSLNNVKGARVHLAIPKSSVFVRDERKPSASVLVELFSGRSLEPGQVLAIINLVATSVPELSKSQITVVDQKGNLLSDQAENSSLTQAGKQFDYSRRMESMLTQRVHNILQPVLGNDRYKAEVSADVDFSAVESTSEQFNPDQPALRSEQSTSEQRTASNGPQGVPGALSNQPPAPASAPQTTGGSAATAGAIQPGQPLLDANGQQIMDPATGQPMLAPYPADKRNQSTKNFELDRSISHTKQQQGRINRLSVSVVVDDQVKVNAADGAVTRAPWSADELARFTRLVQDAVGFDASRGDSVSVINMPFSAERGEVIAEPSFYSQPWFWDIVKQVLGVLFILVLVFGVLRPVLNNITGNGKKQLALAGGDVELGGMGGLDGELANDRVSLGGPQSILLPSPSEGYDAQLNAIKSLVAEDPGRVAQVVKEWINADE